MLSNKKSSLVQTTLLTCLPVEIQVREKAVSTDSWDDTSLKLIVTK